MRHQGSTGIHRVLEPGGIVYSDVPFMQQVWRKAEQVLSDRALLQAYRGEVR